MAGQLQSGIYYGPKQQVGNSYCAIFFRINANTSALEAVTVIAELWETLKDLERGIVKYSPKTRNLQSGNLTTLLGFTPRIFSLEGVLRNQPSVMNESNFNEPQSKGGGPIFEGSRIQYGPKVIDNHVPDDHMVIQFIADNEFFTLRALNELWRDLNQLYKLTAPRRTLQITAYYTGFKRHDGRSWLGFHDGISNIKSAERVSAIAISNAKLKGHDLWTINGTFMAFARMIIDLQSWDEIDIAKQEIIIGRDKQTGCPIIGIDTNGKPIKDKKCPVFGTNDILDPGNERFRDHPPYGYQNLPAGISDKLLERSHIGVTRKLFRTRQVMFPERIYRQSFEFVEPWNPSSGLKLGMNFVSFQWSPKNFFSSLTYPSTFAPPATKIENQIPTLEDFTYVEAGGIFFIPPLEKGELFPGSSILVDNGMKRKPQSPFR